MSKWTEQKNADRIGRALTTLNQDIHPFIVSQFEKAYGADWWSRVRNEMPSYRLPPVVDGKRYADTQWLLALLSDYWEAIFHRVLPRNCFRTINDLRDIRNKWAHQIPFNNLEATQAIEKMATLATTCAPERSEEINIRKERVVKRLQYEPSKIKQVMVLITEAMDGQERPAAEMDAKARAAGFSHGTIQAAKDRLPIRSEKRRDGWWWVPAKRRAKRFSTDKPTTVAS